MITNIKQILTLILFTFTFILVGCADMGASDQLDNADDEALEQVNIEQVTPLKSAFTDPRFENMLGIVENDALQLYVNQETAMIGILDKVHDTTWFSNPINRESDTIASGVNKDVLSAQMEFSFYNSFGQKSNMNTFSDSIQHSQFNIEPLETGVRITFQFGQKQSGASDMPMMLGEDRFEALSGNLDKTGQRALLIAYRLNETTGVYERNDAALTGLQLERALQAIEDSGYTEEDWAQDMAELGYSEEAAENRTFIISMEYHLEGETLLVRVPQEDLYFDSNYPINTLSVMNYFGAAGTEESGSLFVPDGSGALIHFNNQRFNQPPYQQAVYGSDYSMLERDDIKTEETIRLPVFGLIKEDRAMLGMIEGGAAVATINADVSGRLNSYNFVYPSFTVINKGDVTLQTDEQARSLPRFQERGTNEDFEVRYAFFGENQASYTDMANYYQDYLRAEDLLRENVMAEVGEDVPFYVNMIGSITKLQHILGVPYQALESLTTFNQAEDLLTQLMEEDINNIHLNYRGWFNHGLHHRKPTTIDIDSVIGGKDGFKELQAFAREHNIQLYPETALLQIQDPRGFSTRNDAARTIKNVATALYPVDLALAQRSRAENPEYSLAPRLVNAYTEDFLEAFSTYELSGVALDDLADVLTSDFRKNNQMDRTGALKESVKAFESIDKQDYDVLARGGNMYALRYVNAVRDVPLGHTGFKIQNEAIPFYQTVLRGYVDYTTTPFNLSTFLNERDYVLKVLEYGSNINFEWIYASNDMVKDTAFNHLYSVNYEQWIDKAVMLYEEINSVLSQVRNVPITGHEMLADHVYKTTYANGITITVNYGMDAYRGEDETIEPKGYLVRGGQA